MMAGRMFSFLKVGRKSTVGFAAFEAELFQIQGGFKKFQDQLRDCNVDMPRLLIYMDILGGRLAGLRRLAKKMVDDSPPSTELLSDKGNARHTRFTTSGSLDPRCQFNRYIDSEVIWTPEVSNTSRSADFVLQSDGSSIGLDCVSPLSNAVFSTTRTSLPEVDNIFLL